MQGYAFLAHELRNFEGLPSIAGKPVQFDNDHSFHLHGTDHVQDSEYPRPRFDGFRGDTLVTDDFDQIDVVKAGILGNLVSLHLEADSLSCLLPGADADIAYGAHWNGLLSEMS